MLICALLGLAEAARIAGVAVAIVMLIAHHGAPGSPRFTDFSKSLSES